MLKEYPRLKRGEADILFNKLPKSEQTILTKYLEYRRARGITAEAHLQDVRRYLIQIRHLYGKDFKKLTLDELRSILAIISKSDLTNYVKNGVRTDFKNFLKYLFPDWSMRFSNLDDVKLGKNARNEEKINAQAIYSEKDIESLIKHETKTLWRAFLLTQYEGGLRTVEARELTWDKIKFNVDGDISEISIYSPKTKRTRTIFVEKSTFYLKKLREEQDNNGDKGVYVFHARNNNDIPIDKHQVSMWFRRLTKKALGRVGWNYLLRHSRATQLYKLADENKISKETAIKFMGHSKDMSYNYTHLDAKDVKEMLKSQVYKTEELAPEKRHELEKFKSDIMELVNIGTEIGLLVMKINSGEISHEDDRIQKLMKRRQEILESNSFPNPADKILEEFERSLEKKK